MAGCCEHSNELPGTIKYGVFLSSRETVNFSRIALFREVMFLLSHNYDILLSMIVVSLLRLPI